MVTRIFSSMAMSKIIPRNGGKSAVELSGSGQRRKSTLSSGSQSTARELSEEMGSLLGSSPANTASAQHARISRQFRLAKSTSYRAFQEKVAVQRPRFWFQAR